MTRHPTARRVHRQDATPDDAFVAGVLETSAWARKHQRSLIIGGVLLAVIVTSLVLWINNRSNQRERAAIELSQVRAIGMSGNTALAIRELEDFVARYGNTPSGAEARLILGRNYMDAGQPQQAVSTLQSMARNVDTDMGVNAAMLLAAAYEATGDLAQAEQTYARIGSGGRFLFQRQEALDNVARIRLQQGDAAGAIEAYQRIVDMTPIESADRQVFEMRLGEAQARAVSAQGAQPETVPAGPAPAPVPAPGAEPAPGQPPADAGAGTGPGGVTPDPSGDSPPND
ncbi:MAG TPA: tetratricopeptide repeat protein [Longimicrobiales bacterium]|nr:tetratricopeptide repeat protein [Longimicrobiales bacterium]